MNTDLGSFIRQNLWLFVSLLGAVILFFYWQSLEGRIFDKQQQYYELELSYKNIQKNKTRSKNLDRDFEALQALESSIMKRLLNTSNKTQVYGFFLDAEESSGSKIDEPSLVKKQLVFKPSKGDSIFAYTYRVVASGFFQQLLSLFNALEHGERIGFARAIEMSVKPENAKIPNETPIHCTFEISVLGQER